MYQPLALLTGVVLAVMVALNGNLAARHGIFPAAALIHMVGALFALVLCAVQKEKRPLWRHQPLWIYLGGAIGVLTTVFTNLAYGKVSMTGIVALGLLGQIVTAVLVDSLGLFGMEKRPLHKASLWGLAFSLAGVCVMMDSPVTAAALAVILSFGAGVSVVLSRTVNARLAEKIGSLRGSLVNHLVGLPITLLLAFAALGGSGLPAVQAGAFRPWIYCGGMLGVASVVLSNVTVPRISAFRLTVLTFVGQIFTGILVDLLTGSGYSDSSFAGGLIIALGVAVNMATEKIGMEGRRKRQASLARTRRIEEERRQYLLKKYGGGAPGKEA